MSDLSRTRHQQEGASRTLSLSIFGVDHDAARILSRDVPSWPGRLRAAPRGHVRACAQADSGAEKTSVMVHSRKAKVT